MAHSSENTHQLKIVTKRVTDFRSVHNENAGCSDVWLFVLPFGRTIHDAQQSPQWCDFLRQFAARLSPHAILCILTSPEDAAETWPALNAVLKFQLWVAVKLESPRPHPNGLPQHHAALLVLSRYHSSLQHTKTRIAYTYCPACDKTTKDYGGKKHTYHNFGTLMSDVWRDIGWTPGTCPEVVITRLADVFGLPPHSRLNVLDFRFVRSLHPGPSAKYKSANAIPTTPKSDFNKSLLLQGDCLDHLSRIPGNSIDFCFADPPYNLEKKYDNWNDNLDVAKYFSWCDAWIDELSRVLKPGCTCAILNIPLWAIRHFQHLKTKLDFQNWIVWEGLSLPVRMIMPAHYSIVCFSKGKPRVPPGRVRDSQSPTEKESTIATKEFYCARPHCVQARRFQGIDDTVEISDLWWDIHRLKHNSRRVDHPCQLPPALMQRLIAYFTNENEVILDPFNGAGTTTLCAQHLKRQYIGIELSEQYHRIAKERHEFLDRGGDPFAKSNKTPKAKNSRVRRLKKQKYAVAKKTLQLEVKQIAHIIGRVPTRKDVKGYSKYPISYYDDYFISWGEVCAAARTTGMVENRTSSDRNAKSEQGLLFKDP